jgi:hypothetical protein
MIMAEYLTTVKTERLHLLLRIVERQFVGCPPNIDNLKISQRLIKTELSNR